MVHRQLAALRRHSLPAALGLIVLGALLMPAGSGAANRRISISNYSWSAPNIQIDLGEHVTWYWTGPDTMHSVTGNSASSQGLDSDPQTQQPNHYIGDSFRLDFNSPGVYSFRCKLHSTVKGVVTVSATPGDPFGEPDPVPKNNVDRTPPKLRSISLDKQVFGRRGTNLKYSLGEVSRVSADMYRYDAEGSRHFAGYSTWRAHVGWNGTHVGNRSKHFRPRPGSYLMELTATDTSQNTSSIKRLKFRIRKR